MSKYIVDLERLNETIEEMDIICDGIENKTLSLTDKGADDAFLYRRLNDSRLALKSFKKMYIILGGINNG